MENKIIVIEKRFPKFDLLYFEPNDAVRVHKLNDLIYSKGKENFKNKIKNISKTRFDYINLWRESAKQEIIYAYDSIMENHLEIEKEIKYMDEDACFIIRRNDLKPNLLNEIELDLEFYRAYKDNCNFIEKKIQELDYKIEKKLDILDNILRVRQFELKFKNNLK